MVKYSFIVFLLVIAFAGAFIPQDVQRKGPKGSPGVQPFTDSSVVLKAEEEPTQSSGTKTAKTMSKTSAKKMAKAKAKMTKSTEKMAKTKTPKGKMAMAKMAKKMTKKTNKRAAKAAEKKQRALLIARLQTDSLSKGSTTTTTKPTEPQSSGNMTMAKMAMAKMAKKKMAKKTNKRAAKAAEKKQRALLVARLKMNSLSKGATTTTTKTAEPQLSVKMTMSKKAKMSSKKNKQENKAKQRSVPSSKYVDSSKLDEKADKYAAIDDLGERAFAILSDIGIVEETIDPSSPDYDSSQDDDIADENIFVNF